MPSDVNTPSLDIPVGSIVTIEFYENTRAAVGAVLQGGMGMVLQLVPIQPGRLLALKTFKDEADPRAFERECRIWLALTEHPHVAHAVAYGRWRGRPAILVDWYSATLSHLLVQKWNVVAIQQLVQGVIEALEYALEKHGIVHQDIKPSNILVGDRGEARLTDFGIARVGKPTPQTLPRWSDVHIEMARTISAAEVGGTLPYMAPELFSGALPSVVTDIYSLGVTLYEVLTGTHPYCGPETGGRFRPHLRTAPLTAATRCFGPAAEPLAGAIRRCLSLDPRSRPSCYAAVRQLIGIGGVQTQDPSREARINSVAALARALREQGRGDDAVIVLDDALADSPNEPVLLNARGALSKVRGSHEEAEKYFARAVALIGGIGGQLNGRPYPDPVVNLAMVQYDRRDFVMAHQTLAQAWAWMQGKNLAPIRVMYPEFGWMFSFEGRFAEAVEHLTEHLRGRAPTWTALHWLVLAASLGGQLDKVATSLVTAMRATRPASAIDVLCIALVGAEVPEASRQQICPRAEPSLLATAREAEVQIGLPRDCLMSMRLPRAHPAALQALDLVLTGGRYVRVIR